MVYYLRDKAVLLWRKIFLSYNLFVILTSILLIIIFPALRIPFWWLTHITILYIFLTSFILNYFWNQKNVLHKFFISFLLLILVSSAINNFFLILKNERSMKNVKYSIRIQEPIEYIYKDSKNENFKILYITGGAFVLDYKYMFWYVGYNNYENSLGFKNLDLAFTNPGGKPIAIDEAKQFKNLGKGLYYIIIANESIKNGYASKLISNSESGRLIQTKAFENNFIVQKRLKN